MNSRMGYAAVNKLWISRVLNIFNIVFNIPYLVDIYF